MKHTKKVNALAGLIVLMTVFCVGVRLHTMEPTKYTLKSRRLAVPVRQQEQAERYKNKLIWVKTSDNVRMELPQWQIDQMKAMQHKGEGTKYHWVDAPMVTSEELELVQKALNVSDNLEKFRKFYANLSEDQKGILINAASNLEMQGLTSLLMAYFFPMNVQEQIGTTLAQKEAIIAPVVKYLRHSKDVFMAAYNSSLMWCVAYSPNGNYIVSGEDEHLILRDSKTFKQIKILKGHRGTVDCVAYSPDGDYIVSGSADSTLVLWNGKTGEQIKILEGHARIVKCVTYSPSGNYIVSGEGEHLILRDSKTFKQIKILKGHTGTVSCVAYSPDGDYIISGSYDNNLIVWNSKTGEQIKILEGHARIVKCVTYSPSGNYIVSGEGKHLILRDGKTFKQIKILEGHVGPVNCVAYSPDSNYIISGSHDNLILWNGKTGERIEIFRSGYLALCVAYSPDGNYIISGGKGNLTLWNFIYDKMLDYIATQLNLAQARFLHRLYLAQKNGEPVMLDKKDADYQIYLSLPQDIQRVVKGFLPFELVLGVAEKAMQEKEKVIQEEEKTVREKMNELRSSLFYNQSYFFGKYEKTRDQKIKTVKDAMQKVEKDSIDYKACVRLLQDLELEAAFEVD